MRYELTDYEWAAIKPFLPNKPPHDDRPVLTLLSGLKSGAMLLADRGFDADWIRGLVTQRGAWANIPPKCNRKESICYKVS